MINQTANSYNNKASNQETIKDRKFQAHFKTKVDFFIQEMFSYVTQPWNSLTLFWTYFKNSQALIKIWYELIFYINFSTRNYQIFIENIFFSKKCPWTKRLILIKKMTNQEKWCHILRHKKLQYYATKFQWCCYVIRKINRFSQIASVNMDFAE